MLPRLQEEFFAGILIHIPTLTQPVLADGLRSWFFSTLLILPSG